MSQVRMGGVDLADIGDAELIGWMDSRRTNRLRQKTARLWVGIMRTFDEVGPPMTVRQLFYALTSRGMVAKTEAGYRQVAYHVLEMRRCGVLSYSSISDATRWMRKAKTYTSLEAYFQHGQRAYRRALWDNQDAYVEIWLEKDALAGVFSPITVAWDVPLMVTRGYPSETFVFEAADTIKAQRKPAYIYAFFDYDPSGQNIAESTEAKLREFGAVFHFELVAVQRWQIDALGLPTRPTKRQDTRAKNWRGGSVELDAIPVDVLRRMVEETISQHIDQEALAWTEKVEEVERKTLAEVQRNLVLVQDSGPALLWRGGSDV